jgi:hypothetical protein
MKMVLFVRCVVNHRNCLLWRTRGLTKRVKVEICGTMLLGKQYVRMHSKVVHKELFTNS